MGQHVVECIGEPRSCIGSPGQWCGCIFSVLHEGGGGRAQPALQPGSQRCAGLCQVTAPEVHAWGQRGGGGGGGELLGRCQGVDWKAGRVLGLLCGAGFMCVVPFLPCHP
jgi:hypothetical protein